jgi:uncharacterized protein DUF2505
MPRTFEVTVESPASIDDVFTAFGDGGYWLARLAAFGGGTATLDSLSVDPVGTVSVAITLRLFGDRLPTLITQLNRGDVKMVRNEIWSRTGSGRVRGAISVAIPGAPFSANGEALLAPSRNGSRLNYTTTVAVKVPLVGGKIESFIGGRVAEEVPAIQRFTSEWIAENG